MVPTTTLLSSALRAFSSNLALKVGCVIVGAEILVLTLIGGYYIQTLSEEIDQRAADRVQVPGALMRESLLRFNAVADRDVMTELVGEEISQSMVVGVNRNVFHAMNEDNIGKQVSELPDIKPSWFTPSQTEPQLIRKSDNTSSYLISITPLYTLGSTQPYLFTFIKVNTNRLEEQKTLIRQRVLLGSLFGVIATSIIILLSFNGMILHRLQRAANFVELIKQGQLTIRFDHPSVDEIGVLESGMNTMASNLQERGRQRQEAESLLRESKETLEQRVEQRTTELSDAVSRLRREVDDHTRTGHALRRQSSYLRLLQRITVAANESASAEGALKVCLDAVCTHFNWPIGHILNLAEDGTGELISSGLWYFNETQLHERIDTPEENHRVKLGQSLPGRVLRSGAPIWSTEEDHSGREEVMQELLSTRGLNTSFAFPVLLGREVVAVYEFFMEGREKPETGFFEVMRDIGVQLGRIIERKRSEDRLQKAMAQADYANQTKSDFVSNLSHELRTPMNAIMGFAQLLFSDKSHPLSTGQTEQVEVILRAGEHMVTLIDQVLDLAKIEAGEYPVRIERMPVEHLLNHCANLLDSVGRAHQVTEDSWETAAGSLEVMADWTAAKQTMQILMTNTMRYSDDNSELQLGCRLGQNNVVRFTLCSPGLELTDKQIQGLFEPFAGRSRDEESSTGGTGIGLNLTRHLAELMNGRVGVICPGDPGCTFWFELPVASADGQAASTSQTAQKTVG